MDDDAWLCPFCEHIIDPSVLAPNGEDDDDVEASEPTKMAPMPPPPAQTEDDPLPDAMILGDVGVAADEFAIVEGAGVQSNGQTSTFLYYATGASTRVVHPDAVPRLTEAADGEPRTPYEDFILSCIDGARSVRAIQRASGLQPQEVVVTLLTLMDKGAVLIEGPGGGPGASNRDGRVRPDPDASTAGDDEGHAPAPTFDLDEDEQVDTQSVSLPTAAEITRAKSASVAPVPRGFDDEDLPSVSDFHEIHESGTADLGEPMSEDLLATQQGDGLPSIDDEPALPPGARLNVPDDSTELGEPPKRRDQQARHDSSFSDVWAENPSGALDADNLIEDEQAASSRGPTPEDDWGPLTGPIDDADVLEPDDPSLGLSPVMPSDLDPPTDEASAHELAQLPSDALEDSLGPPPSSDPESSFDADLGLGFDLEGSLDSEAGFDPVMPSELDPPDEEPDVTKEVFIPAKLRPTRPPDRPTSRRTNTPPRPRPRSAVVASVEGVPQAPLLDPSLLAPAESSKVAPAPVRPRTLAGAVKRGPIEERDRRRPLAKSAKRPDPEPAPEPAREAPAPEPAPKPKPAPEPARSPAESGVDSVRMMKGQKLYEQALKDKAEGNLLSARMNMKLAITFDPSNVAFQAALDEMEQAPEASDGGGPTPTGRSKAREYYDAATEAENLGNVDRAIELLEKAIAESKQAAFLNRLGVVLAMKKQDFDRAQRLIEEAIDLAPGNTTYEKNLHKILSRAAAADVGTGKGKDKKSGLLGFLGRRK